ncbi:MAG TPA: hypothetical protein VMT22_25265 [Terriglobales bacterium]|nr:hypothetical protein [Terriglobales bacterium]
MTAKTKMRRLHTTVGELITAITDVALGFTTDERNAYRLTGLVLDHMTLRPVPVVATRRASHIRRVARIRH